MPTTVPIFPLRRLVIWCSASCLAVACLIAFASPSLAQTTPAALPAPASPPTTPSLAAPAPVAPVAVPFQLEDGKIVVPATIDGAGPFSLGIDSGAETVMITQHVADQAKVEVKTGTVEISGTTGSYVPVGQAMVDTVQVGNAVVEKPFCTVAPEQLSVDGYIGAPLFNFYVVEIDFANRTLTCIPPTSFRPDPADIAVPITLGKHRVPVVKGEIGGVPGSFEIDTGSVFPAELSPDFVKENDLDGKFTKLGTVGSISVGGPIQSAVYSLPGLVIGTGAASIRSSGSVPTLFLNPAGAPVIGDWDGRIGTPALQGLVVTFDYMNSTLYLRPARQVLPAQSSPAPPQTVAPTQPGAAAAASPPAASAPAP